MANIIENVLLALSAATSFAYFLREGTPLYATRPLLKGAAVGALALIALVGMRHVTHAAIPSTAALVAALAFSTVGDVFLALPGEKRFQQGLAAFLVAHLAYIIAFVPFVDPAALGGPRMIATAAMIASAVIIYMRLRPRLGPLAIPVLAYFGVILTMATVTFLSDLAGSWVALGALLFVVSDALIALDKFDRPIPGASWAIWGTYYAAQILITFGALHAFRLASPAT